MTYIPTIDPLFAYLQISGATVVINGSKFNALNFSDVQVQVDSIGGGDSIAFTRSTSQTGTFYPVNAYDENGNVYSNGITTPGLYYIKGRGYVMPTITGTASSPVITIFGNQ